MKKSDNNRLVVVSQWLGFGLLSCCAVLFVGFNDCGGLRSDSIPTKDHPTGEVFGTVQDVLQSQPVIAAQVRLADDNVSTGADGVFQFANVELGEQLLSVQAEGFQYFQTNIQVGSGANNLDHILLIPTEDLCNATKPQDANTPKDGCRRWICDQSSSQWTLLWLPDGTACDDLDLCTTNDTCENGVCQGVKQPNCTCANISGTYLASWLFPTQTPYFYLDQKGCDFTIRYQDVFKMTGTMTPPSGDFAGSMAITDGMMLFSCSYPKVDSAAVVRFNCGNPEEFIPIKNCDEIVKPSNDACHDVVCDPSDNQWVNWQKPIHLGGNYMLANSSYASQCEMGLDPIPVIVSQASLDSCAVDIRSAADIFTCFGDFQASRFDRANGEVHCKKIDPISGNTTMECDGTLSYNAAIRWDDLSFYFVVDCGNCYFTLVRP